MPPDAPETNDLIRMSFLISKAERTALKIKAAENETTMSEILRQAIRDYCQK